ncbi:MAG TPA: 8-amino-7-oxononanoate synthase [Tepidisphaeraceae bacterium]
MESELQRIAARALEERTSAHLLRRRRTVERADSAHVVIDGRRFVNFSSNDYLGISHHPKLTDAIAASVRETGSGSGASGLMTGYSTAHARAEGLIAAWKGTEGVVLLPSGYQANVAAIQAIAGAAVAAGRAVRFLMDKLVHASLIDAVRGCDQAYRVFGHNDLAKLSRLLNEHESAEQLQVIVTESIFSMDGDAAKLAEIVALKQQHNAILILDEAHGSGVYGPHGNGYAAEVGLTDQVDVFVVTLSKALGCVGGAVCGSKSLCQLVENFSRAYIYSTAIPTFLAAAAEASIQIMREEPQRQQRVRQLAKQVRSTLALEDFVLPPGDSPIIPIMIGTEEDALALSQHLHDQGLLVSAVRPPTVPKGSSRLRVTLSASHSDEQVQQLLSLIISAKKKPM